jgi:3-hydroxybutyryl-CoA dehydrogenase
VDDLAGGDLVVEAVPEVLDLKTRLLASIDAVLHADAVIASNTSSLPVTVLAEATGRPSQVVGMHFFNPAPVLRLVEVIFTPHSSPEVVESVRSLAVRLGKTPIVVGDRPGFVANALLLGYLADAVRLLESGQVSRADLDASLVEAGMPLGPLALLDLIGIDVVVHILHVLEPVSARYAVPPGLAALVASGQLGRKSGQGYWTYERPGTGAVVDDAAGVASPAVADRLLLPYLNDALAMVGDGYASADDVDTAMREGCGFPRGPVEEADARGLGAVLAGLRELGVQPAPLLQSLVADGRSTLRP